MAPSHQISMPLTNPVGCYFGAVLPNSFIGFLQSWEVGLNLVQESLANEHDSSAFSLFFEVRFSMTTLT
ncbi:hypothetical protein Peur_013498 [Populus x canadensis]